MHFHLNFRLVIPIPIIGDPDNQHPNKWGSAVLIEMALRVWLCSRVLLHYKSNESCIYYFWTQLVAVGVHKSHGISWPSGWLPGALVVTLVYGTSINVEWIKLGDDA